jgi:hypothetical protein
VSRPRGTTSRLAEFTLAACLAAVGISTIGLRLLANPQSRLSRWVDRNLLPSGVSFR